MSETHTDEKTPGQVLREQEPHPGLFWHLLNAEQMLPWEVRASRQLQAEFAASQAEVDRLRGLFEETARWCDRRSEQDRKEWSRRIDRGDRRNADTINGCSTAFFEAAAHIRAVASRAGVTEAKESGNRNTEKSSKDGAARALETDDRGDGSPGRSAPVCNATEARTPRAMQGEADHLATNSKAAMDSGRLLAVLEEIALSLEGRRDAKLAHLAEWKEEGDYSNQEIRCSTLAEAHASDAEYVRSIASRESSEQSKGGQSLTGEEIYDDQHLHLQEDYMLMRQDRDRLAEDNASQEISLERRRVRIVGLAEENLRLREEVRCLKGWINENTAARNDGDYDFTAIQVTSSGASTGCFAIVRGMTGDALAEAEQGGNHAAGGPNG